MHQEAIAFVGTSDLAGHFRGKSFRAGDLPARLETGVGVSPSNLFLSAFGEIQYTPFGTVGEVFLVPDMDTRVEVSLAAGVTERFLIGDFRDGDGAPWAYCPRGQLRRALARLKAETGLSLLAAFEQEFTYSGAPAQPHQPYALAALRAQGAYGERLLGALRAAGVKPDTFLAEAGPQQYEVTVDPSLGLRAADDAVITRELIHAVAFHHGARASLAPKPTPTAISNGTHVHFSFLDGAGQPVMYDPADALGLSPVSRHFVAGILAHLPALCAITAPSVASYYRLRPGHWAPTGADVASADRGAAIRISPLSSRDPERRARQYNLEFRVADATASPYLALAALVHAGLDGIRRRLAPQDVQGRPVPPSLATALDCLQATEAAGEWFGSAPLAAYLAFKRAEIASLEGHSDELVCQRYAEAY